MKIIFPLTLILLGAFAFTTPYPSVAITIRMSIRRSIVRMIYGDEIYGYDPGHHCIDCVGNLPGITTAS